MRSYCTLALSLALIVPASAQQSGSIEITRVGDAYNISVEQGDVRDAIRSLMKAAGRGWNVAPKVAGQVTVTLKNVSFEMTLAMLLRQVDATYGIQPNGIYRIIPRPLDEIPRWIAEQIPPDPEELAMLPPPPGSFLAALGELGSTGKYRFEVRGEISGYIKPAPTGMPFEKAFQFILDQAGATYRMENGVHVIIPKTTPPPEKPSSSFE